MGYGCTTCIGNSGPLPDPIETAIKKGDLTVGAVLSGNRNFEGRIHPLVKTNWLASPPLVVAYALAGNMNINLASEPIGHDRKGDPVYLKDIWPSSTRNCHCGGAKSLQKCSVKSTQKFSKGQLSGKKLTYAIRYLRMAGSFDLYSVIAIFRSMQAMPAPVEGVAHQYRNAGGFGHH